MSLIIPSYVPEQHLASALVIQIVLNSLMSLLGGYAIGELWYMSLQLLGNLKTF